MAQQYRQRWEIETNFGYLKTTMKMDILKCQTVNGVLREMYVFALVYNMVRQVMLAAAVRQEVNVRRISFIDAFRWLQLA
ncbi:MAG: transposase, partial [Victivallales bacterium]|nr:transposase [Victivallales bacterium]